MRPTGNGAGGKWPAGQRADGAVLCRRRRSGERRVASVLPVPRRAAQLHGKRPMASNFELCRAGVGEMGSSTFSCLPIFFSSANGPRRASFLIVLNDFERRPSTKPYQAAFCCVTPGKEKKEFWYVALHSPKEQTRKNFRSSVNSCQDFWCNRLLIHDGAMGVRGPSGRLPSAGYSPLAGALSLTGGALVGKSALDDGARRNRSD